MQRRFSTRTQWESAEDAYTLAVREARAAGKPLIDLTASNPTACGFAFDAEAILAPLSDPAAMVYDPDPRGMISAREAVAQYYADHGAAVDPDEIILTTSTSEAYSYLFRLLCDPGDEVLIPQPSYPLFDLLAGLENVTLKPYPLFYDHGWAIDVAELERSITPRTRALLIVHPNNPTGNYASENEKSELAAICARHGLALIVDEVFLDYPVEAPATDRAETVSFTVETVTKPSILTFVLSGMSKIAALPQMKASWLVCRGPAEAKSAALARLEVIADTFLSMNAPVQLALPDWLQAREGIQQQIRTRVRENFAVAQAAGLEYLEWQAGWSLVLRVSAGEDDLTLAARLVHAGVIVHPGSFYGMTLTGRLVVSLLPEPQLFAQGISRLAAAIKGLRKESR